MFKIGTNLKKMRELKSLSRQYVADNVGLSLKTYSSIENDIVSPDVKTLEKLAETFNVSLVKFFDFDDKIILNNYGKHVDNLYNYVNQSGMDKAEKELYEKNIASLKEENDYLKEQNKPFLSLITKPKTP
jgi:transcriptional regulator with XRE-family HTH domain